MLGAQGVEAVFFRIMVQSNRCAGVLQDNDPVGLCGAGAGDLDKTYLPLDQQRQDMFGHKVAGAGPFVTGLGGHDDQIRQVRTQLRGTETRVEQGPYDRRSALDPESVGPAHRNRAVIE
ncbi:hypothetical protein ACWDYH_38990 [Nocardia goodfellowii]